MLRATLLCLILVLPGLPARAQDGGTPIQGVIQSQIDAFLEDDFAEAFTYASPMIKGVFGSPERFGMMVREGYPMVWRPAEVRFLGLRERRGLPVQRVMITDAGGTVHMLDYEMIETGEGWQINGVQLLPQLGA
jgi:hypothetical protein